MMRQRDAGGRGSGVLVHILIYWVTSVLMTSRTCLLDCNPHNSLWADAKEDFLKVLLIRANTFNKMPFCSIKTFHRNRGSPRWRFAVSHRVHPCVPRGTGTISTSTSLAYNLTSHPEP